MPRLPGESYPAQVRRYVSNRWRIAPATLATAPDAEGES